MEFNGLDYIKIDVANQFGLDKLDWQGRIDWFEDNKKHLGHLVKEADNKFLFIKGMHAYRDAIRGKPTGFIMGLDSTASGLQMMACLSGCKKTAKAVNLINTGKREDVYTAVASTMNQSLIGSQQVTRGQIKKPVMTHWYNKAAPDGLDQLQTMAFFQALKDQFTGAEDVKALINKCWDNNALEHSWTAPDGHVVKVKVEEKKDKRISIDEIKTSFTYRYDANMPSSRSTSLCPNYIHSLDGWVAREMVRKANAAGFQLACIHDSFWASPNHMNEVRQFYREILAELAGSSAMQIFLQEQNLDLMVIKDSEDLGSDILQSEYALS